MIWLGREAELRQIAEGTETAELAPCTLHEPKIAVRRRRDVGRLPLVRELELGNAPRRSDAAQSIVIAGNFAVPNVAVRPRRHAGDGLEVVPVVFGDLACGVDAADLVRTGKVVSAPAVALRAR